MNKICELVRPKVPRLRDLWGHTKMYRIDFQRFVDIALFKIIQSLHEASARAVKTPG
jgi:hypothetical protein